MEINSKRLFSRQKYIFSIQSGEISESVFGSLRQLVLNDPFFSNRGFENQTRTYQEEFEGLGGKVPVSRDGQDGETDEAENKQNQANMQIRHIKPIYIQLRFSSHYVRLQEILCLKKNSLIFWLGEYDRKVP